MPVKKLIENMHGKRAKATVIFDYARLRDAIPKVWVKHLKDDSSLIIPPVFVGQSEKPIQYLSCKNFYSILSQEGNLVEGPSYWANLIDSNVNWNNVYKRNLKDIKDNKLKQFNFKLLYNLLPVKRKLFLWQLCNTDTCEACTCREDLYHALLTCKLNTSFFVKLVDLIKHVYNVDLEIDSFSLLKIHEEKNIDDILTIAFWIIYKMIVLRNETGKDERSKRLWYLFLKEIKISLEINNVFVKLGKKKLYRLPDDLNMYI